MTRRVASTDAMMFPARVRRALVRWFGESARDFPWRRSRDPYAVWVSEVMLQQTRSSVVAPYYERFVRAFPDAAALAAAPERDVLRLWEGLGYYRRARALRAGARAVLDRHGGTFPRDRAAAVALPGVGPYTAAAVLSIAYGIPLSCVDGNVRRVVARLLAIGETVGSAPFERRVKEWLDGAIDAGDPGSFNQAMMELGACVCLPRNPNCPACPVARFCAARPDRPETFPRRRPAAIVTARREATLVWRCGATVVVEERPRRSRWEGLWEFPRARIARDADPVAAVERMSRRRYGSTPVRLRKVGRLRYAVTRYRVDLEVVAGEGGGPALLPARAGRVAPETIEDLPMPAPLRKAWRMVTVFCPTRSRR